MNERIISQKILFLGSSIFYGFGSFGISFVDLIKKKNSSLKIIKETVNGTTLALQKNKNNSYIERLKLQFNKSNYDFDKVFIQLSTNDFNLSLEKGMINNSDFDVYTIIGAIEYIINYIKNLNKNTMIYFISCPTLKTYKHYREYSSFINNELSKIIKKYNINLIDLFKLELPRRYFVDDIHPNLICYKKVFYNKVLKAISNEK